jgi:O-antigen/teichoic acid export membrane protein
MILKKELPLCCSVLLMTFTTVLTCTIERLLPPVRLISGIYASAYRLLDSANMIALLFAGLLLPIFARMIKLRQNVEEIVRLSFSLLVIPAFVVVICCNFFSYELMNLLYSGDHIQESSDVFKILMCCFVPISSTYIFGTLLTANGNLRQLNFMASFGMAVNIIMNFILIRSTGLWGCCFEYYHTGFYSIERLLWHKKLEFKKNGKLIVAFLFIEPYSD